MKAVKSSLSPSCPLSPAHSHRCPRCALRRGWPHVGHTFGAALVRCERFPSRIKPARIKPAVLITPGAAKSFSNTSLGIFASFCHWADWSRLIPSSFNVGNCRASRHLLGRPFFIHSSFRNVHSLACFPCSVCNLRRQLPFDGFRSFRHSLLALSCVNSLVNFTLLHFRLPLVWDDNADRANCRQDFATKWCFRGAPDRPLLPPLSPYPPFEASQMSQPVVHAGLRRFSDRNKRILVTVWKSRFRQCL
jgi:hypothetical protein